MALLPFFAIKYAAPGGGGGFVGPSTLSVGRNDRTFTLVRPKDGVTITQDYVVLVGANVDLNAGGFKVMVWFHGAGENGNRTINAVMTAAALPALLVAGTVVMDNWVVIISQQASLTGSATEFDPSYNQNNEFRYQCFEVPLLATLADCNYDSNEIHGAAFSGGGNLLWNMRYRNPTRFNTASFAETNAEARRISLPIGDPTYGAGNATACGLMAAVTAHTRIYLSYNNDGSFQTMSNGLGAMGGAFGDPTWTSNTNAAPTFNPTTNRYDAITGLIRCVYKDTRTTGGGGHECNSVWVDSEWATVFMGGL